MLISLCTTDIYIIIIIAVIYTANKATFAFNKVVRRHYSGKVGEFIIFWCEYPQDIVRQNYWNRLRFYRVIQRTNGGVFQTQCISIYVCVFYTYIYVTSAICNQIRVDQSINVFAKPVRQKQLNIKQQ